MVNQGSRVTGETAAETHGKEDDRPELRVEACIEVRR